MSSYTHQNKNKLIQIASLLWRSFWSIFKHFFITLYKIIDVILEYSVGFLIKMILMLFKVEDIKVKRSWQHASKFVWITLLVVFIFVNNILLNNILFDYTLYFPYKWVMNFFANGTSIYARIINEYSILFWNGIKVTIHLSLIGTMIGFIIAVLFSILLTLEVTRRDHVVIKILKYAGKGFVKVYVTLIRSTPMMVQAMIFFWGLRGVFSWSFLSAGLFTVSINTAAYLTEVLRGAITSIDKGQNEASRSLGLSKSKTMFGIILPQAIKNAMPSIGNEFVINIKDTSVLSVIMVVDIFRVAELAQSKYGQAFPPYLIAASIYLVLTISVTLILRKFERKMSLPRTALPSAN